MVGKKRMRSIVVRFGPIYHIIDSPQFGKAICRVDRVCIVRNIGAAILTTIKHPQKGSLNWAWLLPRLLCGVAASVLGAYIVYCWPFTVDDAFITFRYSQNLAAGYGPTFNPGVLPHAEGYTSFLWM